MFLNYADSPKNTPEGNVSLQYPLEISSCGTYKLYAKKELQTFRDAGRSDYQLIYIAAGKGHFYFEDGKATILEAGNMVLYRPLEPQRYVYHVEDGPEIYWIHFSGTDVDTLFAEYGIDTTHPIIYSGTHHDYDHLFKMIIWELQFQKNYFEQSAALYFTQLLLKVGRFIQENKFEAQSASSAEIERATTYFYEHYRENINIEEYVESMGLSVTSFFRKFKLYTGLTPLQYLLDIRLTNAKQLLETSDYSISEIAIVVGYDNALYFSRLFHKHVGMSPKEYRKFVRQS